MNNSDLKFHGLTDDELVSLAQKGDSGAYSALVGRYIFLVRSCASGYFSDSMEFDDLMQEGFIGLMNAVNNYKCSCGAAFCTFAKLCVERNIISAVRKSLRKKQIPQSMLVFIDSGAQMPARSDDPETEVIGKEEFERLRQNIFSKLSKRELAVLQKYLSGKSYEQIGNELNISQKSVDNAMQRLRAKLK